MHADDVGEEVSHVSNSAKQCNVIVDSFVVWYVNWRDQRNYWPVSMRYLCSNLLWKYHSAISIPADKRSKAYMLTIM
jgi:hypothetical protein